MRVGIFFLYDALIALGVDSFENLFILAKDLAFTLAADIPVTLFA